MRISEEYAAIVALSIRQALATFEITVPAGTLDTSDTKSFMKGACVFVTPAPHDSLCVYSEISSNGVRNAAK
jgi:hypothetical protein